MNYQVTDDEFFLLQSVRGHLGVIAGLLAGDNLDLSFVKSDDLFEVFNTQSRAVSEVLQAMEDRMRVQLAAKPFSAGDLLTVLRTVNGQPGAFESFEARGIMGKLISAAKVDNEMQFVVDELKAVIGSGHSSSTKAPCGKRARKAAEALKTGAH